MYYVLFICFYFSKEKRICLNGSCHKCILYVTAAITQQIQNIIITGWIDDGWFLLDVDFVQSKCTQKEIITWTKNILLHILCVILFIQSLQYLFLHFIQYIYSRYVKHKPIDNVAADTIFLHTIISYYFWLSYMYNILLISNIVKNTLHISKNWILIDPSTMAKYIIEKFFYFLSICVYDKRNC